MGPNVSAGKKVSALTITMTPTRRETNKGVVTGNVPADSGTSFLRARLPARARIGMIMKNRPSSMLKARLTLYQGVFPFNPPNAEPLLAAVEAYAYKIW